MNFTTGQRISTRGEDFIITNTHTNHDDSYLLEVEGISELVKGKRFSFDTNLDKDIQQLDPNATKLVPDTDSGYRKTKLFLETQIRNAAVFSEKISIAGGSLKFGANFPRENNLFVLKCFFYKKADIYL